MSTSSKEVSDRIVNLIKVLKKKEFSLEQIAAELERRKLKSPKGDMVWDIEVVKNALSEKKLKVSAAKKIKVPAPVQDSLPMTAYVRAKELKKKRKSYRKIADTLIAEEYKNEDGIVAWDKTSVKAMISKIDKSKKE
jgi:DNA-binding transcriptional MerR regulator